MALGHCFGFNEVFRKEIDVVNQRRKRVQGDKADSLRPPIDLPKVEARKDNPPPNGVQTDSTGEVILFPKADENLTGLALSGGGVRSAERLATDCAARPSGPVAVSPTDLTQAHPHKSAWRRWWRLGCGLWREAPLRTRRLW